MQIKRTDKSDNEIVLIISGDLVELEPIKQHILKDHFAKDIKIQGFRQGKAPLNLVEKNVDQAQFQSKFLDEAINNLVNDAITQEKVRTVGQPSVDVKKFVPYTLLEIEVTISILGKVTLPDYKKIRFAKEPIKKVTTKDIDKVLDNIRKQLAEKKDVERSAKLNDQLYIDFSGIDEKKKTVNGADGKNYPLLLGSDSFIPGFETNLIGLKAGEEKTFTLKFPKEYAVKALSNRNVTFTVNIIKVQEVILPEVTDEFAAKVGPFSSVAELKTDIKKQLEFENANEANRDYESRLLKDISSKSKVSTPSVLIDEEIEKRLRDVKLNLSYRGMTFQEFLEAELQTEEEYIEKVVRLEAEDRLKASIVLSEISELENIPLTNEEVDARLVEMKAQYTDAQSQTELAKPEARREVASRLLAEKTILFLTEYAQK